MSVKTILRGRGRFGRKREKFLGIPRNVFLGIPRIILGIPRVISQGKVLLVKLQQRCNMSYQAGVRVTESVRQCKILKLLKQHVVIKGAGFSLDQIIKSMLSGTIMILKRNQ